MVGKGKATDARGAMVAVVQEGKAGWRVTQTQVKVNLSPPRLTSARFWRVTFSIMLGMELLTQCK